MLASLSPASLKITIGCFSWKRFFIPAKELPMKGRFRSADRPCPALGRCTLLSTSLVAVGEHPSGSSSPQNPDKPQNKKLWRWGVLRDTMTSPCPQKGHLPYDMWANLPGQQSSSKQEAIAPKTPGVQGRSCHCSLHHPALQGSMVWTRIISCGSRPAGQTHGTQGGSFGSCSVPNMSQGTAWEGAGLKPRYASQGSWPQQRHHFMQHFLHTWAKNSQPYGACQALQKPQDNGSDFLGLCKSVEKLN